MNCLWQATGELTCQKNTNVRERFTADTEFMNEGYTDDNDISEYFNKNNLTMQVEVEDTTWDGMPESKLEGNQGFSYFQNAKFTDRIKSCNEFRITVKGKGQWLKLKKHWEKRFQDKDVIAIVGNVKQFKSHSKHNFEFRGCT
jgi:hypothetical protein